MGHLPCSWQMVYAQTQPGNGKSQLLSWKKNMPAMFIGFYMPIMFGFPLWDRWPQYFFIHSLTLAHRIINGGFSIAWWDDQRGPQPRTDYLSELLPYVPSLLFLIPLLLVSRSHNFHWTLWRVLVKSGKPKTQSATDCSLRLRTCLASLRPSMENLTT